MLFNTVKINDEGFTLIEVLISLSLLSLIVLFLSGGFNLGRRVWERTDIIDENLSVIPVRNFLQNTINRAQPLFFSNANRAIPVFNGTRDSLTFIVNSRNHINIGGLHVLQFSKEKNSNEDAFEQNYALKFKKSIFRNSLTESTKGEKHTKNLLRNIENLQFKYFGVPEFGQPSKWYDEWNNHGNLPDIVFVKISFPRGDGREWDVLKVELKLKK